MRINTVQRAFTAHNSVPVANAATSQNQASAVLDGYSNDRSELEAQMQQINARRNQQMQMAAEFAATRADIAATRAKPCGGAGEATGIDAQVQQNNAKHNRQMQIIAELAALRNEAPGGATDVDAQMQQVNAKRDRQMQLAAELSALGGQCGR